MQRYLIDMLAKKKKKLFPTKKLVVKTLCFFTTKKLVGNGFHNNHRSSMPTKVTGRACYTKFFVTKTVGNDNIFCDQLFWWGMPYFIQRAFDLSQHFMTKTNGWQW